MLTWDSLLGVWSLLRWVTFVLSEHKLFFKYLNTWLFQCWKTIVTMLTVTHRLIFISKLLNSVNLSVTILCLYLYVCKFHLGPFATQTVTCKSHMYRKTEILKRKIWRKRCAPTFCHMLHADSTSQLIHASLFCLYYTFIKCIIITTI